MPVTDPDQTGALLEKTAGGAGWTIGWRAATRALGFLSTLVLARVLVPADFGLVALAMSYAQAIDVFADLGVQERWSARPIRIAECLRRAFTVNAVRGFVTAAVIVAYGRPFALILRRSAAVLCRTGARAGGAAGCVRECRRRGLPSPIRLPPRIPVANLPAPRTGRVTIALAFTWANYWALIAGILTGRMLQNFASYVMHPYRPRLSLRPGGTIVGFLGLDLDGQHGLDGPRARHHADHWWHAESDATRCLHSRLGDCHAAGKRTHRPVEPRSVSLVSRRPDVRDSGSPKSTCASPLPCSSLPCQPASASPPLPHRWSR